MKNLRNNSASKQLKRKLYWLILLFNSQDEWGLQIYKEMQLISKVLQGGDGKASGTECSLFVELDLGYPA